MNFHGCRGGADLQTDIQGEGKTDFDVLRGDSGERETGAVDGEVVSTRGNVREIVTARVIAAGGAGYVGGVVDQTYGSAFDGGGLGVGDLPGYGSRGCGLSENG
jgi:hypothetical protein